MSKPSFKEYCVYKENLRMAAGHILQLTEEYELTKYCKFPIISEEEGSKSYITFRPKDKIEVLWEYLNPNAPTPLTVTVTVDEEDASTIRPAWSNAKLVSWISKNTDKNDKAV